MKTLAAILVVSLSALGQIPQTFFAVSSANFSDTAPASIAGTVGHPGCLVWGCLETSRGVYNWGMIDPYVTKAPRIGNVAQIVLTIGWTPKWATSNQTGCATHGCPSPPDNFQDYTDLMTALVNHYNGAGCPTEEEDETIVDALDADRILRGSGVLLRRGGNRFFRERTSLSSLSTVLGNNTGTLQRSEYSSTGARRLLADVYDGVRSFRVLPDMDDATDYRDSRELTCLPHVAYYELWNEANNSSFWTGSAAQLAAMSMLAYPILKSDPYSQVVTPSVIWPGLGCASEKENNNADHWHDRESDDQSENGSYSERRHGRMVRGDTLISLGRQESGFRENVWRSVEVGARQIYEEVMPSEGLSDEHSTTPRRFSAVTGGRPSGERVGVVPCTSALNGPAFTQAFFSAGGMADLVSFHAYTSKTGTKSLRPVPMPESPLSTNAPMQVMIPAFQTFGKPILITEGGWGVNGVSDPDQQAAWIAHYELLAASYNIQLATWFEWGKPSMALSGNIEDATGAITQAGKALGVVEGWIVGQNPSVCSQTGTIWTCGLGNNLAVWDSAQTCGAGICTSSPWTPPAQYTGYYDLTNVYSPITGTIQLGIKTILLQ